MLLQYRKFDLSYSWVLLKLWSMHHIFSNTINSLINLKISFAIHYETIIYTAQIP
jgi:hypothetical protein